MGCRGGNCSVDTGCGYKVASGGGEIIVYPTQNQGDCSIEVGIGNATITFDPANPPSQLEAIIDGDAAGDYMPPVDLNMPARQRVGFDGVSEETTADGITYKKFSGFKNPSSGNKSVGRGVYTVTGPRTHKRINW